MTKLIKKINLKSFHKVINMNKFSKSLLVILATLSYSFMSSSAHAQSSTDPDTDKGFYLQGGLASLKYTYGSYSYNLGTTYAIYGGYNFNKNIAGEILTATTSTANYSTTLNFTGFFVKPKMQLNDSLELFGRFGSNTISVSSTVQSSWSKAYTSYGGGLTAFMSPDKKQYISAEYMSWGQEGTVKLTGISISYGQRF